MAKYRANLPQLNGDKFITDGGLETTLVFYEGYDLPEVAAFDLLRNDDGYELFKKYYSTYAAIAMDHKVGFIQDRFTWRASSTWGEKLGYSNKALQNVNRKGIELLHDIRNEYKNEKTKMVISGCIGPRGDGYNKADLMTEEEAQRYHTIQIEIFSKTQADFVSASTMNNVEEAIGLTRAAKSAGIPVVISFTVKTDGKLPPGETLKKAIEKADKATDNTPVYYPNIYPKVRRSLN